MAGIKGEDYSKPCDVVYIDDCTVCRKTVLLKICVFSQIIAIRPYTLL